MVPTTLLKLPPEMLHKIFNYLDNETILKLCPLNKNLSEAASSYNRWKLVLRSTPSSDLRILSDFMRPENIVSLTISYGFKIECETDKLLLECGITLKRYTNLKYLTLIKPEHNVVNRYLNEADIPSLVSLTADLCYDARNEIPWELIPVMLRHSKLHKLELIMWKWIPHYVPASYKFQLKYLRIRGCTYHEYLAALDCCLCLKSIVVDDYEDTSNDNTASSGIDTMPQQTVTSLTIGDGCFTKKMLRNLLLLTPSLTHLTLISNKPQPDCAFDGHFWSKLIRDSLPSLSNFEFRFECRLSPRDDASTIRKFVSTFRTEFWLNVKRWHVICDHILATSELVIYTASLGVKERTEIVYRYENPSNDNIHILDRYQRKSTTTTIREPVLHISNEHFKERELKYLVYALQNNTICTSLKLYSSQLADWGSQILAKALEKHSTLLELYLQNNSIGRLGAEYLTQSLVSNSVLTTLSLANNKLGVTGAAHIAKLLEVNTVLRALNLQSNDIQDLGVQHIAIALQNNKNTSLSEINLTSNNITQVGANYIAQLLENSNSLTNIDLKSNGIDNQGMGNEAIKYLCHALCKNTTVKELNLYNNNIDESGAVHLATMLQNNQTLASLLLETNCIGSGGAKHLASAVQKNKKLKVLDLRTNRINEEGAKHFFDALEHNTTLTELNLSLAEESTVYKLIHERLKTNQEIS